MSSISKPFVRLSASVSPEVAERIVKKAEANGKTKHAYVSELIMKFWDKDDFSKIVDDNGRLKSENRELRNTANELISEDLQQIRMKADLYDQLMADYEQERKGFFSKLLTPTRKKLESKLISKHISD